MTSVHTGSEESNARMTATQTTEATLVPVLECEQCSAETTEAVTGCTACGATDSMKPSGRLACSRCGCTDFRFDENYPTSRSMAGNEDGELSFLGNFEWYEGDSDPGVVCDDLRAGGCGAVIDTGEVEINWV